jgi:nucleoid DNA-binding protein
MTIVGVFVLFALSSIFVGTPPPTFFKTMIMIKIDYNHPLVARAAKRAGMSKAQTARIAAAIFEAMQDEIIENKKVHVSGFGHFKLKHRYYPGLMRWDFRKEKMVPREGWHFISFVADWPMKQLMKRNKHKL